MEDLVNHPSHYTQGNMECIDGIEAATKNLSGFEGYLTGNVLKYLWRWKSKNGIQDLRKAKWYLERLINEVEKPSEEKPTASIVELDSGFEIIKANIEAFVNEPKE